jgi:hypothetical protein
MSKMKSTLGASFLTLVLTVPALAGNIGSPGGTPPPPPPPPPALSTTCGNSGSPGSSAQANPGSPELQSALVDLLLTVLFLI